MIWIPGGTFQQGALDNDEFAIGHEKPQYQVSIDGFYIDITEVTNDQFSKFVEETGYITIAERKIDWEEMKKQLPPGTPKPHDSLLQPGSLTFKKTKEKVPNLYDYSQWWNWTIGASWKHTKDPESTIEGKGDFSVVHITYEDALAYAEWAGKRLPTEAEWEYAAKGGLKDSKFSWGNDASKLSEMANTWEGNFPNQNSKK
jgi:formylglycine-generating enzyme required for sulfatase activity